MLWRSSVLPFWNILFVQGHVRLVSIVTCALHVPIKTSAPLDPTVPKALGPLFHACQGPSTPIVENGISQIANCVQLGISAVVRANFSFTVCNWGERQFWCTRRDFLIDIIQIMSRSFLLLLILGAGKTAPEGRCSRGYYCPPGQLSSTPSSHRCPRGFYCLEGSVDPVACEKGTYQSEEGKASCNRCPARFFCEPTNNSKHKGNAIVGGKDWLCTELRCTATSFWLVWCWIGAFS